MTQNQSLFSLQNSTTTPKKSERFPELDAIRAILILYIVGFWHLLDYSPIPEFHKNFITFFITHCVLGAFIFISAFLIGYRYEFNSLHDIKIFFIVRFIRIYPLYFAALIGFLITKLVDQQTFIKSAFLLNMIFDIPLLTLWFITMLFLFYSLIPLFLYKYHNAQKIIFFSTILFIILALLYWKTSYISLSIIHYFPICVFGLIVSKVKTLQQIMSSSKILTVSLFVLAIVFGLFYVKERLDGYVNILVVAFGMFASLPAIWALGKISIIIFKQKIIKIISYSSFCMYLTHRIVYLFMTEYYKPTSLLMSCLYLVGVCLPFVVLISYFIQYYYDLAVKRIMPSKALT